MFKNVASQKIQLFAFDTTTGAPKTGDAANITAYVSKDHGAVTVLTDTSATELDSTNAKGIYVFDLTQAETNADELTFSAKSSTANISITPRFISTSPANLSTLDAAGVRTAIGLASANLDTQLSAIDDYLDTEVAAIKAKTDNLPASPAATGDAMTLTSGERNSVADALLNRNVSGGSSAGRTVKQALHVLRNKTAISGGTLTVYDTDDSTESFTAAVTTAAGDPISSIDPS